MGVPEEYHEDGPWIGIEIFSTGDILWKGTAGVLETNSPTLLYVGIDQRTNEQWVVNGYNINGFGEEEYSLKDIKKWLNTLRRILNEKDYFINACIVYINNYSIFILRGVVNEKKELLSSG